ncbi:Hypothetical protein NGAL_HAMBI1189_48410 [Neorhizobium galegae bv. officinalis]|uniref:Uncharacterized protein n=1 Tax=Neorhizobium galegae bv. officinalis TaxID=323656 RepID=A0A0T7H0T4_NEOGA|nr:Hypothetical protein NGAL_HAMBI1189_48410 [Neorhizobium galegae bv. officinalis]
MEFVKSKYMADAYVPKRYLADFEKANSREKIRIILRASRAFGNPGDMKLFLSSIGFVVITYFGLITLYNALAKGLQTGATASQTACTPEISIEQIKVIGALAFAGAFVAAVRIFLKGLAVFDLSAYTFMRQTIEMLASILMVIFAFKAIPHPFQSIQNTVVPADQVMLCTEIAWYWYALAPSLALLPESSSNFLFTRVQAILTWIKRDDDRFAAATRVVPLDAIEGIDYFIRFRLEECGIQDVQNLATYNPILLSIECPYNIYETVDWIGQAQLCHIVGLDRFLLLREMHVRTIFDLERATDFGSPDEDEDKRCKCTPRDDEATSSCGQAKPNSDTKRDEGSPDEFDTIYAGILFAATATMRDVSRISGVSPLRIENNKFVAGTVDDYCLWARELIGKDEATTKACIEHLMAWISDDLHVRRLRRIWQEMTDNLGGRSERLGNKPKKNGCPCNERDCSKKPSVENDASKLDDTGSSPIADQGRLPNAGGGSVETDTPTQA